MQQLVLFQVLLVTLTCGTNSISMTDGTGAFSVTPTMMRALYTYYATLGTTAVGTLNSYLVGTNAQHTSGSGVFYKVLQKSLVDPTLLIPWLYLLVL